MVVVCHGYDVYFWEVSFCYVSASYVFYLFSLHLKLKNKISFLYIRVYRKLLTEYTSVTMDQMNLVTFGMSAVSLVGAVVQPAMIDSADAESIYRNYLGKVACYHFSLVRLCILCSVDIFADILKVIST